MQRSRLYNFFKELRILK